MHGHNGSGYVEAFVVTNTGNAGVGTTSPNYRLDVRGTIGNNTTLHHSDRRWKRNIEPLTSPLDRVRRLRGISFEWRREEFRKMNFPGGRRHGFIAQEVEEVMPEVVHTDKEGYKSVAYANVVPMLVEALKAQQKTIEDLTERLKRLESKIN